MLVQLDVLLIRLREFMISCEGREDSEEAEKAEDVDRGVDRGVAVEL